MSKSLFYNSPRHCVTPPSNRRFAAEGGFGTTKLLTPILVEGGCRRSDRGEWKRIFFLLMAIKIKKSKRENYYVKLEKNF